MTNKAGVMGAIIVAMVAIIGLIMGPVITDLVTGELTTYDALCQLDDVFLASVFPILWYVGVTLILVAASSLAWKSVNGSAPTGAMMSIFVTFAIGAAVASSFFATPPAVAQASGTTVCLLRDGSLTMTGNLDMDSNDILNIGDPGNDFTTAQLDLVAGYTILGANVLTVSTTAGALNLTAATTMSATVAANTLSAYKITDGAANYYLLDGRATVTQVFQHNYGVADPTVASAANAIYGSFNLAAWTLNWTGNTPVNSLVVNANLAAPIFVGGVPLVVDKGTNISVVAPTEGANITLTDASAIRVMNATGTPTNQRGIVIEDLTAGATADYGLTIEGADSGAIWVQSADPLILGTAGTATGKMEFDGSASGTVTLTVNNTAGTWTMELPAAVGGAGTQLTDAAGNGVTSWAAAASKREYKNIVGAGLSPSDALDTLLGTEVYQFTYKDGKGTGDTETIYTGVMADESPWAMHYQGGILNPVNALGYTIQAFKGVDERVDVLEEANAVLEARIAALEALLVE